MTSGLEVLSEGFFVIPLLAIEEEVRAGLVILVRVDAETDLARFSVLGEDSFVAFYPVIVAVAFAFDFLLVTSVLGVEFLEVITVTGVRVELGDLDHLVQIEAFVEESFLGVSRFAERMTSLSGGDLNVVAAEESREEFVVDHFDVPVRRLILITIVI